MRSTRGAANACLFDGCASHLRCGTTPPRPCVAQLASSTTTFRFSTRQLATRTIGTHQRPHDKPRSVELHEGLVKEAEPIAALSEGSASLDVESLIVAAVRESQWERAVKLLTGAIALNYVPTSKSYSAVLRGIVTCSSWQRGLQLVHSLQYSSASHAALAKTLLLLAAQHRPSYTPSVLHALREDASLPRLSPSLYIVCCRHLLRNNAWREALDAVAFMSDDGVPPSEPLGEVLLETAAQSGRWDMAVLLLDMLRSASVRPTEKTLISFLRSFSHSPQWELALRRVSEEMDAQQLTFHASGMQPNLTSNRNSSSSSSVVIDNDSSSNPLGTCPALCNAIDELIWSHRIPDGHTRSLSFLSHSSDRADAANQESFPAKSTEDAKRDAAAAWEDGLRLALAEPTGVSKETSAFALRAASGLPSTEVAAFAALLERHPNTVHTFLTRSDFCIPASSWKQVLDAVQRATSSLAPGRGGATDIIASDQKEDNATDTLRASFHGTCANLERSAQNLLLFEDVLLTGTISYFTRVVLVNLRGREADEREILETLEAVLVARLRGMQRDMTQLAGAMSSLQPGSAWRFFVRLKEHTLSELSRLRTHSYLKEGDVRRAADALQRYYSLYYDHHTNATTHGDPRQQKARSSVPQYDNRSTMFTSSFLRSRAQIADLCGRQRLAAKGYESPVVADIAYVVHTLSKCGTNGDVKVWSDGEHSEELMWECLQLLVMSYENPSQGCATFLACERAAKRRADKERTERRAREDTVVEALASDETLERSVAMDSLELESRPTGEKDRAEVASARRMGYTLLGLAAHAQGAGAGSESVSRSTVLLLHHALASSGGVEATTTALRPFLREVVLHSMGSSLLILAAAEVPRFVESLSNTLLPHVISSQRHALLQSAPSMTLLLESQWELIAAACRIVAPLAAQQRSPVLAMGSVLREVLKLFQYLNVAPDQRTSRDGSAAILEKWVRVIGCSVGCDVLRASRELRSTIPLSTEPSCVVALLLPPMGSDAHVDNREELLGNERDMREAWELVCDSLAFNQWHCTRSSELAEPAYLTTESIKNAHEKVAITLSVLGRWEECMLALRSVLLLLLRVPAMDTLTVSIDAQCALGFDSVRAVLHIRHQRRTAKAALWRHACRGVADGRSTSTIVLELMTAQPSKEIEEAVAVASGAGTYSQRTAEDSPALRDDTSRAALQESSDAWDIALRLLSTSSTEHPRHDASASHTPRFARDVDPTVNNDNTPLVSVTAFGEGRASEQIHLPVEVVNRIVARAPWNAAVSLYSSILAGTRTKDSVALSHEVSGDLLSHVLKRCAADVTDDTAAWRCCRVLQLAVVEYGVIPTRNDLQLILSVVMRKNVPSGDLEQCVKVMNAVSKAVNEAKVVDGAIAILASNISASLRESGESERSHDFDASGDNEDDPVLFVAEMLRNPQRHRSRGNGNNTLHSHGASNTTRGGSSSARVTVAAVESPYLPVRRPPLSAEEKEELVVWAPAIVLATVRQLEELSSRILGARFRSFELKLLLGQRMEEVRDAVARRSEDTSQASDVEEVVTHLTRPGSLLALLLSPYAQDAAKDDDTMARRIAKDVFLGTASADLVHAVRARCGAESAELLERRWPRVVETELISEVQRRSGKAPTRLATAPWATKADISRYWGKYGRLIAPGMFFSGFELCLIALYVPRLEPLLRKADAGDTAILLNDVCAEIQRTHFAGVREEEALLRCEHTQHDVHVAVTRAFVGLKKLYVELERDRQSASPHFYTAHLFDCVSGASRLAAQGLPPSADAGCDSTGQKLEHHRAARWHAALRILQQMNRCTGSDPKNPPSLPIEAVRDFVRSVEADAKDGALFVGSNAAVAQRTGTWWQFALSCLQMLSTHGLTMPTGAASQSSAAAVAAVAAVSQWRSALEGVKSDIPRHAPDVAVDAAHHHASVPEDGEVEIEKIRDAAVQVLVLIMLLHAKKKRRIPFSVSLVFVDVAKAAALHEGSTISSTVSSAASTSGSFEQHEMDGETQLSTLVAAWQTLSRGGCLPFLEEQHLTILSRLFLRRQKDHR